MYNGPCRNKKSEKITHAGGPRDYLSLKNGRGLIGLYPFTEMQGDSACNLAEGAHSLLEPAVSPSPAIGRLGMADKRAVETLRFYQDVAVGVYPGFPLVFSPLSLLRFTRRRPRRRNPAPRRPPQPGHRTDPGLPRAVIPRPATWFSISWEPLIGLALLRLTAERRSHSESVRIIFLPPTIRMAAICCFLCHFAIHFFVYLLA